MEFLPIRMAACPSCGLLFQASRSSGELHQLYDEAYFAEYDSSGSYAAAVRARVYEANVRLRLVQRSHTRGRMLEVGSATGFFLRAARSAGFEVVGIEPSEEAAALARRLALVEVHANSVEDISLPEREFDVVCGWHVLEHIANPLSTLHRLRRAIAPAGVALFEVPNFQSVRGQRERLAWRLLQPTHHVAQYGPRSLAQLLARAGFDDVEVETVPWAVYRRWPRSVASYLKQAVVLRSWPAGPHPAKHELLRAVARVRP